MSTYLTKREFRRVMDDPVSLDGEFRGDDYVCPLGDVQEHDCADGNGWGGCTFIMIEHTRGSAVNILC